MTCGAHPRLIQPKTSIRRTIIVLRPTACHPSDQNVYPGGEPWHQVRATYYVAIQIGRRGFTDRTKSPRLCRGLEQVKRHIAIPTIVEALLCYRRTFILQFLATCRALRDCKVRSIPRRTSQTDFIRVARR